MKVVTSDNYVTRDSGLVLWDIEVGKGDCPKDGQQVFLCSNCSIYFLHLMFDTDNSMWRRSGDPASCILHKLLSGGRVTYWLVIIFTQTWMERLACKKFNK